MTNFEVVLVPFPFTDQTTHKQRPAVVVTSEAYHRERPDLLLLAVTSQMRAQGQTLDRPIAEWQEAGLLKPSLLKPLVATVQRSVIIKRLGRLAPSDRIALRQVIEAIIGK
jgi:mRNA interferase MazF